MSGCFVMASSGDAVAWSRWTWPPAIVLPLFTTGALYGVGFWRLLCRSGRRSSIDSMPAWAFSAAWLSLLVALDSPIHELGEQLFWVHMTQHEILMLVSAPLLIISRPITVFLWALPMRWRTAIGRLAKHARLRSFWRWLTLPLVAWSVQAVALWLWHAPSLFDATLKSDTVHALQHISFLGSALLFWWTLLPGHQRSINYGGSILYAFTTAVHTSVLGALLTFSSRPWYEGYLNTAPFWRMSAIKDQQLGGLIMWVPAGVVLTGIGISMIPKWLKQSDDQWLLSRACEMVARTEGQESRSHD